MDLRETEEDAASVVIQLNNSTFAQRLNKAASTCDRYAAFRERHAETDAGIQGESVAVEPAQSDFGDGR